MKTAILLSGGIDSTSLAFWCHPDYAFTVNYGQLPVNGEIRAAEKIAHELKIKHEVINIDSCKYLGSGDLVGLKEIPIAPVSEWWPYRNQLLITIVAMKAVSYGIDELIFGSVKTDNVHIDGSLEFFLAIDKLLSIQEGNIRVRTPAINLSSIELVNTSKIEPSLLFWTHSCHKNDYACGNCRGCYKHSYVLSELGYIL
jgi:7-cyano-7-deazaguanine synthase